MTKEKPKKKDKKDIIDRVVELARLGQNDSQIARLLKIHRTTVKRYRELGEKRIITIRRTLGQVSCSKKDSRKGVGLLRF